MESRVDWSKQAFDYITVCCPRVGAFQGTDDVNRYLQQVAIAMERSKSTPLFPDRYIRHVACAVDMVASNPFTSSPAAIASVYLATRFEFYFRIVSGKLNADGTWISPADKTAARTAIADSRLAQKRISSVSLAYKIMMLERSHPIVQQCASLDDKLYSKSKSGAGSRTIADIGDRIEFGRHAVGHGHLGDISSEALFYGLMTAIVFYNQA